MIDHRIPLGFTYGVLAGLVLGLAIGNWTATTDFGQYHDPCPSFSHVEDPDTGDCVPAEHGMVFEVIVLLGLIFSSLGVVLYIYAQAGDQD